MKIYPKFTDEEMAKLGFMLPKAADRPHGESLIPKHIGIIMDGNGRWAKKRLLPRSAGHRAGMESLKRIVRFSHSIGLEALTVYAFSTENWGRPKEEVSALFSLLVEYFHKEIDELHANGVKITILGDMSRFQPSLLELMTRAVELTKDNTGLKFNVAINYGGRAEIVHAVKTAISAGIRAEDFTEETISRYLYTSELPELDLIIRTAGEQRLSNFLLWQSAYAEYVFTPTLFPDFSPEEYQKCITEYLKRTRKFGLVK